MAGSTDEEPIPEERVPGILARAAELDRDRQETSSVDALREAALEAGISQSALDAALEEYATSTRRPRPSPTPAPAGESGEKSERVGTLLAVFLGGFGGHRFYLGDKRGLLYLPFFWTFVPTLVGLVEAFYMGKRVRDYNERGAEPAALEARDAPRALEPAITPGGAVSGEEERRPCPHCAELILPGARICRYCRSSLGS